MKKNSSSPKSRRAFIGNVAAGTAGMILPMTLSASLNEAAGNPVVHFEIGCKDLEKTTTFYTSLFGWTKTPIPSASLLATNSSEGIQGHITALGHEPHQYVTFYIQVDDINDMIGRVKTAGGTVLIGPVPLPDKRQFAWFKDPEGNMVALITKV